MRAGQLIADPVGRKAVGHDMRVVQLGREIPNTAEIEVALEIHIDAIGICLAGIDIGISLVNCHPNGRLNVGDRAVWIYKRQ